MRGHVILSKAKDLYIADMHIIVLNLAVHPISASVSSSVWCNYKLTAVCGTLERVSMNDNEYMRRVRAIEGRLFRVAQAILWREADSVDAVQEAVFKGWMKKDRLNDADRLEQWLTRILVNVCRDMLRRRKRDPVPLPEQVSREDSLCEDLQLRLALKALPEKYRLPLVLHHLQGWPVADVAAALGIPRSRAASRLHQARKALRALLDGGDE